MNENIALYQARYTDEELLKIFPLAKEIIPKLLSDYKTKKEILVFIIRDRLLTIQNYDTDEFTKFFCRELVKLDFGNILLNLNKNIRRLKFLIVISRGNLLKGTITDDHIRQAREVSIIDVVSPHIELRKTNRNYTGRCPFHDDKYPSFTVYPQSNKFHCFGCNIDGNPIDFVMKINGFDFLKAVRFLIEG